MAVLIQPGEWSVRFEVERGLAEIPETTDAQIGLMDGLGIKTPPFHKPLDLARTPSGSSMDTALNSPQGSSASTGTSRASASGEKRPSSSCRASRRLKIEEVFFQFSCDDREDSTISTANMGSVTRYLGHRLSETELQRLIQEADKDGGGSLDLQEFIAMAEQLDASAERARVMVAANCGQARLFSSPAKNAREREFRRIFVACMQPEDQCIATKDLGVVIRLLGYVLREEELQKTIEEADQDGGGTLDYEEFLNMAERLDEARSR